MTTTRKQKKYLWFGFGNYSGQPIQQIGGGIMRDPNVVEELQNSTSKRSPLVYIFTAVIGFTLLIMLLVRGLSLFLK